MLSISILTVNVIVESGGIMSHLHVPDGLLNIYWVIGSLVTSLAFVFVAARVVARQGPKAVARLAFAIAFMVIIMSVPLGFLPVHLNMAAFVGAMLGGTFCYLAAFAASFILALFGHGGLTTIGLNALILGLEGLVASILFHALHRRLQLPWAVGLAVACTLFVTLAASLTVLQLAGGEAMAVEILQHDHDHDHVQADAGGHTEAGIFVFGMLPVLGVGIALESLVSYGLAAFLGRTRPELLHQE